MVVPGESIGLKQVQTLKPGGAKGVRIDASMYLEVARAILQHLSRNEEVTIVDLLSAIEDGGPDSSQRNGNFVYIALHVKLDLESRGYLKVGVSKANPGQVQKCIRMTKEGWTYFKSITVPQN
jgi:hypothetical protein